MVIVSLQNAVLHVPAGFCLSSLAFSIGASPALIVSFGDGDDDGNDEGLSFFCTQDASIAHRFHLMREKHPEKFNSRWEPSMFQMVTGCRWSDGSLIKRACHVKLQLTSDLVVATSSGNWVSHIPYSAASPISTTGGAFWLQIYQWRCKGLQCLHCIVFCFWNGKVFK